MTVWNIVYSGALALLGLVVSSLGLFCWYSKVQIHIDRAHAENAQSVKPSAGE